MEGSVQCKNGWPRSEHAGILRVFQPTPMRNITKILLLIVLAFVVYLLWPRTPNLNGFDPAQLARLEIQNWQAQKAGKEFGAVIARYKIFSSQYHFAPISSYRIAQSQADALNHLKLLRQPGADPAEENRTLSALTEKYTWIKQQVKGAFDPDAMARDEFGWRTLELDGGAPNEVAASLSRILAGLYGGAAEDFIEPATNLVAARALVFNDDAAAAGGADAQTTAQEAYTLLKEIAATPVAAPSP